MKWSWKVGKLAGIDLRIHTTFLLLLIWIIVAHWLRGHSLQEIFLGVAFIVALFGCVVLHELGHALTARRFGVATHDITLLPIGGVARLERMPENPRQELWIALAGPAVNVVIAALLFIWLTAVHLWQPVTTLGIAFGSFSERLFIANVWLVLFNLIPAFPMDGGRVLRALLASKYEYATATHIAAIAGQALALVFAFFGLFANPMLLFIALFVWIGANQEASATELKSALYRTPVTAAMMTDFSELQPSDTLSHAMNLVLSGPEQDFPVVQEQRVVGILTRADLLAGLAQHGPDQPVSSSMCSDFEVAQESEMLEAAFERAQQRVCRSIPVLRGGRLVGLVTTENLGEFLLIQAALKKKVSSNRPGTKPSSGQRWFPASTLISKSSHTLSKPGKRDGGTRAFQQSPEM